MESSGPCGHRGLKTSLWLQKLQGAPRLSNVRPLGKAFKHPVTAWLTKADYDFLKRFAVDNNVSVSAYMRAIVIDAIMEEKERTANAKTITNGSIVNASQVGLG